MKGQGCEGISRSRVSRICGGLDRMVDCLLAPPLDGGPFRFLLLDALGHRVRGEGGSSTSVWLWQPRSMLRAEEIVGMDVGTS